MSWRNSCGACREVMWKSWRSSVELVGKSNGVRLELMIKIKGGNGEVMRSLLKRSWKVHV